MKIPKSFYMVTAVIGTIIPWLFFAQFITQAGLDLPLFATSLFVNGAAGGFATDVLIAAVVFLVWATADARQRQVRGWWLIFPAAFFVGLSLALPLYLYLRPETE